MKLLNKFGASDCHSHVFGPFACFPLSPARTFDPPESPIEKLEEVWGCLGLQRAVLVQGSAHGEDHAALLAAIQRSPQTRRGVALLGHGVSNETLTQLDLAGIRAVRFNWIHHLLGRDSRSQEQRLAEAACLAC
jgi:predicted TIM-barrel fold metal-dependent hydrolase